MSLSTAETPALTSEERARHPGLLRADGLPQLLGNDPKALVDDDVVLGLRLLEAPAAAGTRVAPVPEPVPDPAPDVLGVLKDPVDR